MPSQSNNAKACRFYKAEPEVQFNSTVADRARPEWRLGSNVPDTRPILDFLESLSIGAASLVSSQDDGVANATYRNSLARLTSDDMASVKAFLSKGSRSFASGSWTGPGRQVFSAPAGMPIVMEYRPALGIMLLLDFTCYPVPGSETIQSLFRLSSAEAVVCQQLSRGLTVNRIADEFKLSPHTIRTQLKTIFRKVGISSQNELLHILWRSSILEAR